MASSAFHKLSLSSDNEVVLLQYKDMETNYELIIYTKRKGN